MLRTSEVILNFILNSVWQIPTIFAIATLGSWSLKNCPARYRHTLGVVALAAFLIVPLITASRVVPAWVSSLRLTTPSTRVTSVPATSVVTSTTSDALAVDHIGPSRTKTVTASRRSVVILVLAYVLFIVARAVRLARCWRRKEKLRRSALRAEIVPHIELLAQHCRKLLKLGASPVAVSNEARVPYTIGTLRPLIVLPKTFCTSTDEARLLSVLAHEMAHVKRNDFLTNLICELLVLPVSFHPLTYLIKRHIDRTRELACDELVTRHVLVPKVYARSLLWAAHVSRQHSSQAFMLSIFDGKILEERIVRLMKRKKRVGAGVARVLMFAALSVLCASALSLSLFSLELQTHARAAVSQTAELLNLPATQHPVPSQTTATAEPARTEPPQNEPAAEERARTACKAGLQGDVAAIPSLIAMLADDSNTQLMVCWNIGRWSPALQTFKHPSPGEQAAIALASFGSPAYGPLSQQISSSNATVRRNAAWAIGELTNMAPGERASAVPQLITLLGDNDDWVRMAAARALGEVRDSRALTKLVATLADDDWRVRELAVWALSEMKDARAVNALCSVLLSDVRGEVRRGAAEALGEIANAQAIPTLKQALNDPDTSVSAKAAWAISEIEG